MSQEEKELVAMLRQATRGPVDRSTDIGDEDPERLAETWRDLSRLLAAEQREFDSQGMLKQFRQRIFRHRTRQYGMLAAAAILLIAVGLGSYSLLTIRDRQGGTPPNSQPIVKNQIGPQHDDDRAVVQSPVKLQAAVKSPEKVLPPSDGQTTDQTNGLAANADSTDLWNSSIDSQIAQLDKEMQAGVSLSQPNDRQIEAFDRQLTSFRQQVEADSL